MAKHGSEEPRWKRLGRWFFHWLPWGIVTVLVPLLLTASPFLTGRYFHLGNRAFSWALATAVAAFCLLVPASVSLQRNRTRVDDLERKLGEGEERVEAAERSLLILIRDELQGLSGDLDYVTNERISLFRCEDERNGFVLVERYSLNPAFDRSKGRALYPQQGVLWTAWLNHKAEASGLPATPLPEAGAASEEWIDAQEQLGISRKDARNFAMRSRSYAARRIDTSAGGLGVVVGESMNTFEEHAALREADSTTVPRADAASLDAALEPRAARLAVFLDRIRPIDAQTLVSHREALQQERFGVAQQG